MNGHTFSLKKTAGAKGASGSLVSNSIFYTDGESRQGKVTVMTVPIFCLL